MDDTLREEADTRLTEALRGTGAFDPRPACRNLLRELKLMGEGSYEEAIAAFEHSVVEPIGRKGADPLATWLEYGCELAQSLHPGRQVVVDQTGRAAPLGSQPSWKDLILHIPDDRRAKCVVVGRPPELSGAQTAAVDLLSVGTVKLSGV